MPSKRYRKEWEREPHLNPWLRQAINKVDTYALEPRKDTLKRNMNSKHHVDIVLKLARKKNVINSVEEENNITRDSLVNGVEENAANDELSNVNVSTENPPNFETQPESIDTVLLKPTDRSIGKVYKEYHRDFQEKWSNKEGYRKCIKPIEGNKERVLCTVCQESMTVTTMMNQQIDSYLCINVRYVGEEKVKIVDTLWELVEVYDDDENSTT
ncbi:hypothetical protein TSAR_001978 [Trichomalopsis sarcophagae]|uniref:Uncharacterized protein n=1 Tax=Trichomalopsis sarcophagae TaxID=543379 RepID=A0A232EFA0_9HYME|nr:hypothetical protein TSAR_001978 [Trichomalopsis sarcophagae]